MVLNEDFEITEETFGYKEEDDLFGVKILQGKFAGVGYTYGTLNFPDDENPDGTYSLSFDYKIRVGNELVSEEMTKEFEIVIGNVLNSVLLDSLKQAEMRYNNETRNANSEASDIE